MNDKITSVVLLVMASIALVCSQGQSQITPAPAGVASEPAYTNSMEQVRRRPGSAIRHGEVQRCNGGYRCRCNILLFNDFLRTKRHNPQAISLLVRPRNF